jgi:hypothetical protein
MFAALTHSHPYLKVIFRKYIYIFGDFVAFRGIICIVGEL